MNVLGMAIGAFVIGVVYCGWCVWYLTREEKIKTNFKDK